jgi:hypothetical protein
MISRDDRPSSPLSATTPVVLRILPKAGSSAPIGYIYDPEQQPEETRLLHDTQYCSVPSNHTRTIPAAFGPFLINMV